MTSNVRYDVYFCLTAYYKNNNDKHKKENKTNKQTRNKNKTKNKQNKNKTKQEQKRFKDSCEVKYSYDLFYKHSPITWIKPLTFNDWMIDGYQSYHGIKKECIKLNSYTIRY